MRERFNMKTMLYPTWRKRISGFLLFVIWFIADIPFMMSYLPVATTGHDLIFHLYRIEGIAQGLIEGQFPVRMQTVQAAGYGYPVSIMYGDIFLYPVALLVILGMSINNAYKFYVLALNAINVLVTFGLSRRVFKSNGIAVALAALWTLAPYRLEDIYLRASVGEYTALLFLPILFYGLYRLFAEDAERFSSIVWVTAGCTGIILSHVLSIILAFIPCSILVVYGLVRNHTWTVFKKILLSLSLTLLISLWFIVPFFDYQMNGDLLVQRETTSAKQSVASDHAIEPAQLFTFLKPMNGVSLGKSEGVSSDMPFSLGWALLCGGCICLLICLLTVALNDTEKQERVTVKIVSVLFLLTIFLSTSLFHWGGTRFSFWNIVVGFISTIQFPWRFLGISSFLLVLLSGFGLFFISIRDCLHNILRAGILVLTVLALVEGGVCVTTFLENSKPTQLFSPDSYNVSSSYGLMTGEYLPSLTDKGVLVAESARYPKASGAEIANFIKAGTQVEFDLNSQAGGSVELPLLSYPHYIVRGSSSCEGLKIGEGHNGLLVVKAVNPVKTHIVVEFVEPLAWRISEVISLISLFFAFEIVLLERRRVKENRKGRKFMFCKQEKQ